MFPFLSSFFANPLLLAGAAAGSIPIIIHLFNRQRYKKMIWAAMHWLWASYKKTQRRFQIEQLILLLIRILLIVLLAFALARPALQEGMGLLGGQSSIHRVIVLDNSYSMGQLVSGKPLFKKARELALELIEKLSINDEVDVLLANSGDDELAASTALRKQDVKNQVAAAVLSDEGTDIPRSIASACRVLNERKSKCARREIIVITDQTRAGWEHPDHQPRCVRGDDETAIAKAFSDSKSRPRIFICRLPGDKDPDNLASLGIEVDEKVVPARVEIQLVGTVISFSSAIQKNVKVKLNVDGEEAASEMIASIAPNKPETVNFRHIFADVGSHTASIEIESDVLSSDNVAYLSIDVEDQMRVLCVDGEQRAEANASEMDYFRQALAPSKGDEIKAGAMPLFPEVISDSAFSEVNLDNYRLVVLGNVAMIPREKIQALEQFVRRGGSLWIFLGNRVDPLIYNMNMDAILPMAIGELVGNEGSEGPSESLDDKNIDHPAIAKFKGIKGLPLSHLHTFRRFKLIPKSGVQAGVPVMGSQPGVNVRPVLLYENGELAAVEQTLGENGGHVLLFGTTIDKAWNDWPCKNQYMPLMNHIALYLIQPSYLQRNRQVGENFIVQLQRQDLGAARREGIRLVGPDGESCNLEIITEQCRAESGPIRKAGVYTAQFPGEVRKTTHFVANRNTEESDLSVIDDREILSLISKDGESSLDQSGFFKMSITQADVELNGDDIKNIEEKLKKSGGSREIWRWLAGTVLALLFLESLLARRFGDFSR